MTLGWTDGNIFFPVNSSLLASSKDSNLIGPVCDFDGRSLAAKRRKYAQMKGTDVMIELIKSTQSSSRHANYVLFGKCFSIPAQLIDVKDFGLDFIAMIKKNPCIHYEYEGKRLSIKKIFCICKKRLDAANTCFSKSSGRKRPEDSAKIVCVRNKKNREDWIAFICTNTTLSEGNVRIHGKRQQIETSLKICKTYLQLVTECHNLTYDAQTAHIAIVFIRYLMIEMEQRRCTVDRTLGEFFFFFMDELADITFGESFQIINTIMSENVCAILQPTEEQKALFNKMFIGHLPEYICNSMEKHPWQPEPRNLLLLFLNFQGVKLIFAMGSFSQ